MSLLWARLGACALLLVVSTVMAALPFCLSRVLKSRRQQQQRPGAVSCAQLALSCLQCLAGGALVATVFVHMLPELRERLQPVTSFPLAEVVVCAGMWAVYFCEELALSCNRHSSHHHTVDHHDHTANYTPLTTAADDKAPDRMSAAPLLPDPAGDGATAADDGSTPDASSLASFRVLVITLALSVHSVFEGLAIGLESSSADLWTLTGAVVTHKAVVAFCVAEQLAASGSGPRRALLSLGAFVLASPVGVLAATALEDDQHAQTGETAVAAGILQALAAGTVLYVAMFEIIVRERSRPGSGLVKLAAVVGGFVFMTLLVTLVAEPED